VDGKESSAVQVVYAGPGRSAYVTKTVEPRSGLAIETSHDARGRILLETRSDKSGKTLEKRITTWADAQGLRDRVSSLTQIAEGIERKTEYEYDKKGNRVAEREYRNGILERSIVKEGRLEKEDLFRNGKRVLSSVYENGVKKKDVRVVPVPVVPVITAARERRSPLGAGR
jgi:YD repeat-containing protein